MAKDFVDKYIGSRKYKVERTRDGKGRKYELEDGTYITYQPGGSASNRTSATTATVEINNSKLNMINQHHKRGTPEELKLKFPKISEVKK